MFRRNFFVCLLGSAAFVSAVGMVCVIRGTCGLFTSSTFAEFLLVFVLAVEGIAAFIHVSQDGEDSRTERLMKIQEELGSVKWLETVLRNYRSFPLTEGPVHKLGPALKWELKQNDKTGVEYAVHVVGQDPKKIIYDMSDPLFSDINKIAECYHRIGQLYERQYISQSEFLDFQYLPVIRNWRRLQGFVEIERTRRPSAKLWQYFESLAMAAEKRLKAES